MTDDETSAPRKPVLRRLLLSFGMICIAAAITLAMLALLPPAKNGPEPEWLARIPAQIDNETTGRRLIYATSTMSKSEEIIVGERVRTIEMPFDDFVARLKGDLKASDGWNFSRPPVGNTASWNRASGDTYASFWVTGDNRRVKVMTSYTHPQAWPEKARRWLRNFFGKD